MDDQTRDAIRRLTNNPDFHRYMQHLRDKRQEVVELTMGEQDPPCLYRYQGSYHSLNAQIQEIEKIHDVRPQQRRRPIV